MRTSATALQLKKGREKSVLHRHPWVFSGALERIPDVPPGTILPLLSPTGEQLASAYVHPKTSITARVLAYGKQDPIAAVAERLTEALEWRKQLFSSDETTMFRLVNEEGDGLPGLIIDRYEGVLLLQIKTYGMELLKGQIIDFLRRSLDPFCLFEKSKGGVRLNEGLPDRVGALWGHLPEELIAKENNLSFFVELVEGQKTGFFLDQRVMRQRIQALAYKKRVCNLFGYTGAFSVYALAGGATEVHTLDSSRHALQLAEKNIALNQLPKERHRVIHEDGFQFLRQDPLPYDLVILDPPAFVKKRNDLLQGCRGYKEINLQVLRKLKHGGMLLTSSCSQHVDEKLFRQILFQAAAEAGRRVEIIGKHEMAADHPLSIYHPESDYLKSFLLLVR